MGVADRQGPERFTLHFLRRRGTSHALNAGLTGEDLKLMVDWASDAYPHYLDIVLDRRVKNMVMFTNVI